MKAAEPLEPAKPLQAKATKVARSVPRARWPGGKPWSIRLGEHVRLTPGAQYRPRLLANSGKDFADGNTVDTIRHRARLSLLTELGRHVQIFLQLQDVRTWGEEANTLGDYSADGFDAHQAWVELTSPCGHLSLRVGRQELNLDGQRLVGAVAWTEQARSFDGALVNYARGALTAKLFWYKLRDQDAEGITDSTDFAGLWANYKAHPALAASIYMLYDRDSGANRDRITTGALIGGKLAGFNYTLEGYLQAGQTDVTQGANTVEADILAFMFAAELGYTLPLPWKPRLVFFADYVSGDGDGDDKVEVFDTLFATNHKFYGFMDFFLNLPANTAGRGLIDLGGRLILKPWAPLMLRADVHAFMLAKTFEDPGGDERYLGLEVDGTIRYKLNRWVGFELVGGVFAPGRGMTCIRGGCRDDGETELFGYLQLNAKL